MREMARQFKRGLSRARRQFNALVGYLEGDAEVKQYIKNEMTEAQCRKAVKKLARGAIAKRARFILAANRAKGNPCRPKDALAIARIEYKQQMGGFR